MKKMNIESKEVSVGQRLQCRVMDEVKLGYKIRSVEGRRGMIYHNTLQDTLKVGDDIEAIVRRIRDDGKIDFVLPGQKQLEMEKVCKKIMNLFDEEGDEIYLSDRSAPQFIDSMLGISKKKFKIAIGGLFKQGKIEIFDDHIKRVSK